MAGPSFTFARYIVHQKKRVSSLLNPLPHNLPYGRLQRFRNLILQSVSEHVRMERLSGANSGIIEVKLERPAVKNAIGKDMLSGLQHSVDVIRNDRSASVVIIGSLVPKVFCAGADLNERRLMSSIEVRDFAKSLRSTFSQMEALPIPTIAVVEGAALGGGMELALSCDLRICGEDAAFALPETGLAIIPGAGATRLLPRLVGKSIAKDLIFTGRRVDGKTALSIGLVNYCVPAGKAYSKALEIAHVMMQKGPVALKVAKQAIDEGKEATGPTALQFEEECYEKILKTKDRLEGLEAFAEKRMPIYKGE